MKALPQFSPRPREAVWEYAAQMLTDTHRFDQTHLRDLIAYPDGHYRALFDPGYFLLAEGETQPSKSQWNSLKKKFKRHNPKVFMFKEHGETEHQGARLFYVDFGFFAR